MIKLILNNKYKLFAVVAIIVLASFLFLSAANAQEIPGLEPLRLPGAVEGEGTHFEITDSSYLNIALDSAETIKLKMESVPEMVTMFVESASSATSTQITLMGFNPNTTYYKYEDNYHNLTAFTADSTGSYSYSQDLRTKHFVFIQPRASTKFIKDDATGGDCYLIGAWDAATKTCTLIQNIYETIQIDSNGITLDGGGYSSIGSNTGSGIYFYSRRNVTVKNLNVSHYVYGTILIYSSNNLISNNTFSYNVLGIFLSASTANSIFNNIVMFNTIGVEMGANSGGNNLSFNILSSNNRRGIDIVSSDYNILLYNTVSDSYFGIIIGDSGESTLSGNTLSNNKINFILSGLTDFHYNQNIDTTNLTDGKPIYYIKNAVNQTFDAATNAGTFYCIMCNNVIIKDIRTTNNWAGVTLYKTQNSTVENITGSGPIRFGVSLLSSSGNTVRNNSFVGDASLSSFWLYLKSSNNNLIAQNNVSAAGLTLDSGSSYNEISGNIIKDNGQIGIFLLYGAYNNKIVNNVISHNLIGALSVDFGGSGNEVYNNDFIENTYQIYYWHGQALFNQPAPTGGNYWSDYDTAAEGCVDANSDNICDSPYIFTGGQDNLPWVKQDGWAQIAFWAEITGAPDGKLQLRQTMSTADDLNVLKVFPNGWAINVTNALDDQGNQFLGSNNVRWYKVIDATDNTAGWMQAQYLPSGGDQISLQNKAAASLVIPGDTRNAVLDAVNNYYSNSNTIHSLYSSDDNALKLSDKFNNSSIGMPKEMVLAVVATETGPKFNNETVAPDFGYGVMQLTVKSQKFGIKNLQILLNADPDTQLAATGTGSPGNETVNFGDLTEDAVKRFQVNNGITVSGIVDEDTWLALNSKIISNTVLAQKLSSPIFRFNEELRKGDTEKGFDNRGIGSGIGLIPCSDFKNSSSINYFKNCQQDPNNPNVYHPYVIQPAYNKLFKYYGNSRQSIFANVKDGLTVLRSKHGFNGCGSISTDKTQDDSILGSATYSPFDRQNICAIWGYNGFSETFPYLTRVGERAAVLATTYFPGYNPALDLAELSKKFKIADKYKTVVQLGSPGELRVKDSQGRITGVVSGQTVSDIPDSLYDSDSESILLMFPSDNFTYQVIGTEAGIYSLTIHSDKGETSVEFNATGIPTANSEAHNYSVNFEELSAGGKGVILKIDEDGDGVIDRVVTAGTTLTDITPPVISPPALNAQYVLNTTTTIQFSATDDKSGVASVTSTLNGAQITNGQIVTLTQPGTNALIITAIDNQGNIAILSQTFSVVYSFGGFLPPIKPDGAGIYKQGRTLPVKFQLMDANNHFVASSIAYLYQAKIQDSAVGTDEVSISTGNNDIGNQFRYDSTNNQYIFNFNTKSLSVGTWQLKAALDDGANYTVVISIKP